MKNYSDLPQNQMRKVLNFKHCIANLEDLRRTFGFAEDEVVNQLLQILRDETERTMDQLKKEDVM